MSEWKEGSTSGQNERLLRIAEKVAKLGHLSIEQKLEKMRSKVRQEVDKSGGHPILKQFADMVEKIRVE